MGTLQWHGLFNLAVSPLPTPLSSLVGREEELGMILTLLRREDVRLVSLVGTGGVGKTRLAIEAAHRVSRTFDAGIMLASLADVPSGERTRLSFSPTLPAPMYRREGPEVLEVEIVDGGRALILLDTFEHLLDASVALAGFLESNPNVTALVTSRAPLRVSGEHVVRLDGLEVPRQPEGHTVEALRASPAVQLFVERARANDATFGADDNDIRLISHICAEMDGIPLAIELAAAQVTVISPATLLQRIADDLPLPIAGGRAASPHRRTINDTIRWSYELLPDNARRTLRLASVFEGSFRHETLEAISRSLNPGEVENFSSVLQELGLLVDHHLIQVLPGPSGKRYQLLNTIHRFAKSQLSAAGDMVRCQDAHAQWYIEWMHDAGQRADTDGPDRELYRLQQELPNLTRALQWFASQNDGNRLLELATSMQPLWLGLGLYREGAGWLRRALELQSAPPPPQKGRALIFLGMFHSFSGALEEADQMIEQGISLIDGLVEPMLLAAALAWQASIAVKARRLERAETLLHRAMAKVDDIADENAAMQLRNGLMSNLGVVVHAQGDLDAAARWHLQSLDAYEAMHDTLGIMRAQRDLARIARDRGEFRDAVIRYQEALRSMLPIHDGQIVVDALEGIALALTVWRRNRLAATLLGAATAMSRRLGIGAAAEAEQQTRARALAALQAALDPEDLAGAMREGGAWTIDQAIAALLEIEPGQDAAPGWGGVHLTPREGEVLSLLALGQSDQEIADHFFLSVRTVESHVQNLRAKFGVSSRAAVVSCAFATGVLTPEPSLAPSLRVET